MLAKRLLAAAATVSAAVAVAAIGGQLPANAYEISSISASRWAYTNSHDSGSSFVNLPENAPVGRQEPEAGDKFKARFYFAFDLARFNGKKVSQASLLLRERSAADCTAQPPLEVWLTGPIGSNPTWNHPPNELEKLGTPLPGSNYQCPGYLGLDILDAVRAAQARGDAQLTLELRIADRDEGDRRFGRTFFYRPTLNFEANTVPTVGNLKLYRQDVCGTQVEPTVVWGNTITLSARVSDADPDDAWIVRGQFAVWPVDQPSQRREFGGSFFGSDAPVRADFQPGAYFAHGTVVAWSARAYDGHDYSEWAPPCYFVVDSVAPANAPTITSTDYPAGYEWPGSGGPGVPGTFVLDAGGDTDVVAYEFRDFIGYRWSVPAPAPGAAVSFVYTPSHWGPTAVYATALDRAGNRSPEAEYRFLVRDTTPGVTVEMNGINLTSRLILTPTIEGITHYRYRIDDGAEVTVPADAEGKATAELVFTDMGSRRLTVSSYTATGLAGVWNGTVWVTDAPKVGSTGYDGFNHMALVGQPLTWTFTPRAPNVVAYEYRLNWDQPLLRIDANADGVAVFDWTPTEPGVWNMLVRSVYADGSTSQWNENEWILIQDPRPYISSYLYNPWSPEGGVGVASTFVIYSEVGWPTEFILKLNDGAEFTVPTGGSNTVWVELAPDRAGENVLTAKARYEDGTVSPVRVWTFLVA